MSPTVQPPVLQTPRLTLRPPAMADFADYAAFLATERAWGMGGPLSAEQAWTYFTNDVAQWPLLGLGGLMICPGGGAPVGQVAVCHGPIVPEPEIGWLLYQGHEGQGLALEAALAIKAWALGPRGLASLVSYIAPANTASIRLAQRLGGWRDDAASTPAGITPLTYRYLAEGGQ